VLDSTQKFTGRAEAYKNARPNYAPALLGWLKEKYALGSGKVVADMGSGTGIFTQALLSTGATVYAVEPNSEMRTVAEDQFRSFPNFISVPRPAEATSLPEHTFDLITAAQAFHWFDSQRFNHEADRLLKPMG
jgi:ubiquinone/menaquinone biosynthesis C-methylase UbiE